MRSLREERRALRFLLVEDDALVRDAKDFEAACIEATPTPCESNTTGLSSLGKARMLPHLKNASLLPTP